jgi:4-hydroxybenzoate polyprenyltransferase
MVDTSNGMSGRLGGAQGIAWFGFCLLAFIFCLFFFNGLVFDGRNNTLEEC